MTVAELRKLLKDIPDDTKVLTLTSAISLTPIVFGKLLPVAPINSPWKMIDSNEWQIVRSDVEHTKHFVIV